MTKIKLIQCTDCKMDFRLINGHCSNCPYIIDLKEIMYDKLKMQLASSKLSRKEIIEKLKANIFYGVNNEI